MKSPGQRGPGRGHNPDEEVRGRARLPIQPNAQRASKGDCQPRCDTRKIKTARGSIRGRQPALVAEVIGG